MVKWDEQTDIAVVGSGAAGLSAAIEAAQAGVTVIVFEKMKVAGGNTRISDGGLAAPGNYLQRSMGVEDSPELLYDDMLQAGLGLNHPHLVRLVAEKAAEAIDWTRTALGVNYLDRLDRFGGHSVARCLTTSSHSGADITRAQTARLKEAGVEIRTRCKLVRLLSDAAGAVSGIQIRSGHDVREENSGTMRNVRANRAVILATGGFGNDIGFRTLQNPRLDESIESTNHRGATAEGLVAALRIGAAPVHLSWIQMGPWGCADERGYGRGASFASYSVYPAGIVVDPVTGSRIVNEWADRRQRSEAIIKVGHVCVGIVDSRGAQKATDSLERCLKLGTVKEFESLADLGAAYGMPSHRFEETVNRYNQLARHGDRDEFGKQLDKGAQPLDEPPFYAIRLWPKVHYSPGGLGINVDAQVLGLDGRPIPRLFAAGEVCGGIHGASRLGSCALTECIVFGRIAGQKAALQPSKGQR
ncbi:MAG: flavocytochrome c [Planctomycetota bacterium]